MKPVLDVCCGGKMFYFDKQNESVHFCDIRKESHTLCDGRNFEVNPNTVADFRNLPFRDESFYLVVFDPPHLFRLGQNSWMAKKYGKLDESWRGDLAKGFDECMRVLKPGGTLVFKWNENQIKLAEVLKCFSVAPLLGQKTAAETHWLVFFKGAKSMSYKTELQELQRKLVEIKDKKKQAQKAFFKIAGEQIQEDFPFHSLHENIFESLTLSFSTNGKFKCSKTITYDLLFLDNITFRLYHEKGQTEKAEKAKQIIEKLYKGESDERD